MNKLLKYRKGYRGGEKGTKFSPLKAAGSGGVTSQEVSKQRHEHKLAGNSNSDKG